MYGHDAACWCRFHRHNNADCITEPSIVVWFLSTLKVRATLNMSGLQKIRLWGQALYRPPSKICYYVN